MGKFAKDDQEDDEAGDPAPVFVSVDNLVAEQRHKEGRCCYDNDARVSWDAVVHCIQQLRANDYIDRGPADTSKDVEDRD